MKVIQAHKYYWHRDGASNYALYLSSLLEGAGHVVIPFAMRHEKNLSTSYAKYFVSEHDLSDPSLVSFSEKIRAAGTMLYSIEAKQQMAALLTAEKQVNVAHIHNIYHHISPSIFPVLKRQGVKIVMTLHDYKLLSPNYTMFHHGQVHEEDGKGWYLSCIENRCMKNSRMQSALVTAEMIWHHKVMRYYERYVDHFIAPSRFMLNLCVRFGWDKKKITHIPHPIDTSQYASAAEDGNSIAYIGRLSEEKGLHVLLDAAKKIPSIPIRLVGDGPLSLPLRRRAEDERIANVTFVGFQTGDALAQEIAAARVLVLPSVWYENYPLSILEAKAAGKITIGSRIGGIPELLPADLLADSGNSDEFAKQLAVWYDTPLSVRRDKGFELQQAAKRENDPLRHLASIVSLYQSL